MPASENRLIAKVIANGDGHAFAELVKLHQSRIRGYLLRLTKGDGDLSDDLAQEVFMQAFRKIKLYQGQGTFSGWLHRIAYTSFLQNLRSAGAREKRESDWQEAQHPPGRPHDIRIDVETALATLKTEERSALTLCFSQGYSHREACDIMGIPLGTLKSHIARGKEKLSVELKHFKKDWS